MPGLLTVMPNLRLKPAEKGTCVPQNRSLNGPKPRSAYGASSEATMRHFKQPRALANLLILLSASFAAADPSTGHGPDSPVPTPTAYIAAQSLLP